MKFSLSMASLNKKEILITAGSTRGYIDVVRYITNTSTGKLGTEIALEAMRHDAVVTYIYGKDSLCPVIKNHAGIRPSQLKLMEIETNNDLIKILQKRLRGRRYDAIVHAMAIADYIPAKPKYNKIPSGKKELIVKLVRTPKVISVIRNVWPDALLVGFKLEVNKTKEELIKIARGFLKRSKADMIIANDYKNISRSRHTAYMISNACHKPGTLKNKKEIAKGIILYLEKILK
ncbi:MAG: phosphopantothenoylcysteine decarboxylase [Candidatus Scalinduaceae bacterium]